MSDIKRKLAWIKTYYNRGSMWLNFIQMPMLIIIMINQFSADIHRLVDPLGIGMVYIYVLGFLAWPVFCISAGILDHRKGIWEDENNAGWITCPMSMEHYEKTNQVYEMIKKKGQ